MGSSVVPPEATPAGGIESSQILEELNRVISSPVFRGSKRCQSFLQYVVVKTLEGETKTLKERTLAIEVFGRDESEDLTDDSIVRVGAREVRKRLAQFYVDEGAHDAVRIELPPGSYIPHFQLVHAPETESQTSGVALQPQILLKTGSLSAPAPAQSAFAKNLLLVAFGALAAIVVMLLLPHVSIAVPTSFDVFWKPALTAKVPPVVLLAHPIVYQPSTRASQLDEEHNGKPVASAQRAIDLPPQILNGSDFVPAKDQFVGLGDAIAALRLSSMFVQRHTIVTVRSASHVDFADLRKANAVLIGAYTNRWTIELTKSLRFHFSYTNGKPCIVDGAAGCRWTLTTKTDNGQSTEDYILVSRLPHPATSGFVVVCAGLNVYGTEEGGRLISDPDSLSGIIKRLPSNWPDHNLQLVIHVSVVGDSPAQSEVVAAYTW